MIGKVRVEKELRECKGKSRLHMIRPVTYAHAVTLVEDHQDKWHQDKLVSIMEDKEEKAKYKNHRNIQCPQERLKYAPKKPKYSAGVGVKRRFGDCIWSKSEHERFTQAEEMWRSTVRDKRKWDWLLEGWEKYASKNGLFCHFKLRESLSDQENIGSSNEEEGGGQEEVELVLEGDDDYEVGRDDEWKTTDTVELPVAISGDNAPTDQ